MSYFSALLEMEGDPETGLKKAYQTVFDRVEKNEDGRFNAKEVAAVAIIRANSGYSFEDRYSVYSRTHKKKLTSDNKKSLSFQFNALPDELITAPDLVLFSAAHEYKHASIFCTAKTGGFNLYHLQKSVSFIRKQLLYALRYHPYFDRY